MSMLRPSAIQVCSPPSSSSSSSAAGAPLPSPIIIRGGVKRRNADLLISKFKGSLDSIAKRMHESIDEYNTTTAIITDMFSMAVDTKIAREAEDDAEAGEAARQALRDATLEPCIEDSYEVRLALEVAEQCAEFARAVRGDLHFRSEESQDMLRQLKHCFDYVSRELGDCIQNHNHREVSPREVEIAAAPAARQPPLGDDPSCEI